MSQHETLVTKYFAKFRGDSKDETPIVDNSIFLCFTNRCGSTLVGSELSRYGIFGSPDARKNYEYFDGDTIVEVCKREAFLSLNRYVSYLVDTFTSPNGFFSTKVSVGQLAWLTRIGLVKRCFQDPNYIFVRRRNTVAQAISLSIAVQSRRWTSLHAQSDAELRYDPDQIVKALRNITMANALFEIFFELHGIDPIRIVYEDVESDASKIGEIVQERLGISFSEQAASTLPVTKQRAFVNGEWEVRFRAEYRR